MAKNRIVEKLYKASGGLFSSKTEALKVYDLVMNTCVESLCETGSFRFSGVGTLAIVKCAEKRYRSPSTRKIVVAPAHKRVRFRQSKILAQRINSPDGCVTYGESDSESEE